MATQWTQNFGNQCNYMGGFNGQTNTRQYNSIKDPLKLQTLKAKGYKKLLIERDYNTRRYLMLRKFLTLKEQILFPSTLEHGQVHWPEKFIPWAKHRNAQIASVDKYTCCTVLKHTRCNQIIQLPCTIKSFALRLIDMHVSYSFTL